MSYGAIKSKRMRGMILELLQTNHDQQKSRFDSSMVWSALVLALQLAVFAWHGHLQAASWARGQAELSFAQVARQLQTRGLSLAEALIAGGERLRAWLRQVWSHLLWTTRKGRRRTRQTTWQALQENWLAAAPP